MGASNSAFGTPSASLPHVSHILANLGVLMLPVVAVPTVAKAFDAAGVVTNDRSEEAPDRSWRASRAHHRRASASGPAAAHGRRRDARRRVRPLLDMLRRAGPRRPPRRAPTSRSTSTPTRRRKASSSIGRRRRPKSPCRPRARTGHHGWTSRRMLDHCRRRAEAAGVLDRLTLIHADSGTSSSRRPPASSRCPYPQPRPPAVAGRQAPGHGPRLLRSSGPAGSSSSTTS